MERRDHIKSGCYIMEIQILHWFETLHNPITNPIFYVITTLGNAGWFWIVLAVLMLTVLPKKYKKAGLTMAIALILSLSSGFQKYINDVQEETLATYPVQITKKAMDYSELLSKMVGNNEEDSDHNHAGEDKVYSGDIMGDMLVSMVSDVKENDLECKWLYKVHK